MSSEVLDQIRREKRIVICCGSGGVGKTTTSASLALRAAMLGRKAVVCTIDPAKRLALFQDALAILREGESQWVPTSWGFSGAIMDYRLQGYNVPESEQLVKHWEATWWDPDAEIPPP